MTRIKLTVQYKGTNYSGWQSQINGVAVQDVLEKALGRYYGDITPPRVYAAGRTDVGVHAEGQTVHFDTDRQTDVYKLCLGLNTLLPPDVAATAAETVPDGFDARRDAVSKTYRYKLYVSPTRRPLLDETHAQLYHMPSEEKMRAAARLLTGTHDFACFQKKGSNLCGTVRTINSYEVERHGQDVFHFVVNGNAFLYNMVRITAGAVVAAGIGRLTEKDIVKMLEGESRHVKTMPARGLTLEKVFY